MQVASKSTMLTYRGVLCLRNLEGNSRLTLPPAFSCNHSPLFLPTLPYFLAVFLTLALSQLAIWSNRAAWDRLEDYQIKLGYEKFHGSWGSHAALGNVHNSHYLSYVGADLKPPNRIHQLIGYTN